jgi:hypothetical protein
LLMRTAMVPFREGKTRMSYLNDDDSRVVDLIMHSGSNRHPGENSELILSAATVDDRRVAAVGRVLELLARCPTWEPPQNLVQQTLRRIESAAVLQSAASAASERGEGASA